MIDHTIFLLIFIAFVIDFKELTFLEFNFDNHFYLINY